MWVAHLAAAAGPVPWLKLGNTAQTLGPGLHLEYEAGDKSDRALDLG